MEKIKFFNMPFWKKRDGGEADEHEDDDRRNGCEEPPIIKKTAKETCMTLVDNFETLHQNIALSCSCTTSFTISLLANQRQFILSAAHVNCQLSKVPRTQIKIVQPLSVLENGAAVVNVGDL